MLNEKQWQMVLDNERLVYYLIKRRRITINSPEYDDMFSIGLYGLTKAVCTFDETKNIKFGTYAAKVIDNEINMYLRKNKKYYETKHLNDVIATDVEGKELQLMDILEAPSSNFDKEIETIDEVTNVLEVVLNDLNLKQKIVILYEMADVNQKDIANMLKISQSYVSRLRKKSIKAIKEEMKKQRSDNKIFSVRKKENTYRVTFKDNYLKKHGKNLEEILQKLKQDKTLPSFMVKIVNKQITIIITSDLEDFTVIAKLIYEVERKS